MLFFHALLLRLEKLDHRFCTFLLWLFPYPYSGQSQIPNWDLWARKHGNLYKKHKDDAHSQFPDNFVCSL